MICLKPAGKSKIKPFLYSTFDVEANKWINHLCNAVTWKDLNGEIKTVNFLDLKDTLDFLYSENHKADLVFAHAGGIFDFDFLLDQTLKYPTSYWIDSGIQRSNGFLSLKIAKIGKILSHNYRGDRESVITVKDKYVYFKKRIIEFRDSTAILPFSLDSLSKNFNVENKKQDFDVTKINRVTKKLLAYNAQDALALYQVLEKYSNWPMIKEVGVKSTMASQSVKLFTKYITQEIPSLTNKMDDFVRKSYFGGRTEIFKFLYESKGKSDRIYYYDVNSLYPYCMLEEMPLCPMNKKVLNIDEDMGFVDCTVEVSDMYIPPLPTVQEINTVPKLIFPIGTFRGVFSTIELKYAMSLGVKVLKIHSSQKFESGGTFFKPYIEAMYDIRKKAEKGSVDSILAKLLMNSLYGRFGLNKEREELVFNEFHPQDGDIFHSDVHGHGNSMHIFLRQKTLDKSFTNVAIASWVTSLARIHMHKNINRVQKDIYMMDTDSMLVTKELKSNDSKLGDLKLEYKSTKGAFILPKTYFLEKENGQKSVVMKGFDKRLVKEANFTFSDFQEQFEGEIRLKTGPKEVKAKLRTAVRKGAFLAYKSEVGREIRSVYDKRRIIKNSKGEYDTEPLVVKKGKAINLDVERQSSLFYKIKNKEKQDQGLVTR